MTVILYPGRPFCAHKKEKCLPLAGFSRNDFAAAPVIIDRLS